jgi:hypothetical protein
MSIATARPQYIERKQEAAQKATAERALKQFQNEHKELYWTAWNGGFMAFRVKRVIIGTRLSTEFVQAYPNPYKKGSYQSQAWEKGFSSSIWEWQMGEDL